MTKRAPMEFPNLARGLSGLTDPALKMHLFLYQKELEDLVQVEKVARANALPSHYSDANRLRNAVLLHESYFGALVQGGREPSPAFLLRINEWFGSLDVVLHSLASAASTAASCWGVLVEELEPPAGEVPGFDVISLKDHDVGSPFGRRVLFALDGWEHAYWTDFGPAKRAYLYTALRQIDWMTVEARAGGGAKPPAV